MPVTSESGHRQTFNMDLAKSFAKCKVMVVGDLMLDQYWWGIVDRISPEAPVPVVKLERVTHTAGGAANVAANVAGLGAEPLLIGTIGRDAESQLLTDQLSYLKIKSTFLAKSERPTPVKTRIVAHSQHVVRVDRENSTPLDYDLEATVINLISDTILEADIVVLSDYAKGTLTQTILKTIISAATKRRIPVLVDPKGKDFSKYRGVSIITPNKREALEACHFDDSLPNLVNNAGEQLVRDLSLDAVVITEGERGMTLFEKGKPSTVLRASAHEIYDVTGAGDTVIACLAVALAAGLPRLEAVRLANLAAGLVVEQVGTTAISIEALLQKLDANSFDEPIMDAAQL